MRRQFIAILIAAAALGWVYNTATPLGVRETKSEETAPIATTRPQPLAVGTNSTVTTSSPPAPIANGVPSGSTLRWSEVKPLLESGQIVLVDARPKTAYDLEHIPGALSLPTESPAEDMMAFAMKHPPDTVIVVYCSGENCDLSRELGEKLRKDLGFKNVKEMPGGIVEYRLAERK